jgi:lysozyme
MDGANIIIDLSHHNSKVDFDKVRLDGIRGVIHKATQGQSFVDPMYGTRQTKAVEAGVLWGAYHFGTGGDGVAQAEFFLDTVNPSNDVLLVLDLEQNPQGPSMGLEEARAFVTHIYSRRGRWPGIYSGHYIKALLGTSRDPVLVNCWFWLAQYGSTPVLPPNWSMWTIWQYTDGAMGPEPHSVRGVGRCDRDVFHGDAMALKSFWVGSARRTAWKRTLPLSQRGATLRRKKRKSPSRQ